MFNIHELFQLKTPLIRLEGDCVPFFRNASV
jgi:hypothetical protein